MRPVIQKLALAGFMFALVLVKTNAPVAADEPGNCYLDQMDCMYADGYAYGSYGQWTPYANQGGITYWMCCGAPSYNTCWMGWCS